MMEFCRLFCAGLLAVTVASTASAGTVHNLVTGDGIAIGVADTSWSLIAPNDASATPYVVQGHPNWRNASEFGSARWLSPADSGTTDVADGDWVYSLALNLEAGVWEFTGDYSSDNIVTEIRLVNGSTDTLVGPIVPQGSNSPDEQFQTVVDLNKQTVVSADGDFRLEFVVHNTQNFGGSPSGLIVNGNAALVPLPAAAWGGLALLGGMGGMAGLRRRFHRA
jgi:hypothetical protein